MGQPYIGEIRMFAGNFAPNGWEFCSGQLIPIAENETLFVLIGTTYGGDGQTTFALPDLRGRLPVHQGTGGGLSTYAVGQSGGVEDVTLTTQQIPSHGHTLQCTATVGNLPGPENGIPAECSTGSVYQSSAPGAAMAATSVGTAGGSQPHANLQPFLCVNYIISMFGIFPSQS
jgi:microcystin-dependent protein